MESNGAVLSIESLNRRFGQREVVRSLDLAVEPGRRVALWGPNGSGKSTVLRCVAGTLIPTAGSVQIAGYRAGDLPPAGSSARRFAGALLLSPPERQDQPSLLRAHPVRQPAGGSPGGGCVDRGARDRRHRGSARRPLLDRHGAATRARAGASWATRWFSCSTSRLARWTLTREAVSRVLQRRPKAAAPICNPPRRGREAL